LRFSPTVAGWAKDRLNLVQSAIPMTKPLLAPVLALLLGAAPALAQYTVVRQTPSPASAPAVTSGTMTLPQRADAPAAPAPAGAVPFAPAPAGPAFAPEAPAPGGGRDWYGQGSAGTQGQFFWVSGEYLLWWTKDSHTPPLVSTGTPPGTGRLGEPGTAVLFGGNDIERDPRSGGRFALGYWLDDMQNWSLQTNFLILGDRATSFVASSDQFPVLSRPFFDVTRQAESAEVVAFPGAAAGSVAVNRDSMLWSWGLELTDNVVWCPWCRVDVLAGLRFLDLRENLTITEASSVNAGAGAVLPELAGRAGGGFTSIDAFKGINRFLGGTIGATAEVDRGNWSVTFLGKVSLGGNKEEALVAAGADVVTHRPVTALHRNIFSGGLLGAAGASGDFLRTTFAAVPELGVTLGYQVTDHVRLYGGYSFLYFSDVIRPESLINPNLRNREQATDFWAQGLNFGMSFNY
jgi:hypothetical protein